MTNWVGNSSWNLRDFIQFEKLKWMQNNKCPTSHLANVLSRQSRNKSKISFQDHQLFIKKISTHRLLKMSFSPGKAVCDAMAHLLAKYKLYSGF